MAVTVWVMMDELDINYMLSNVTAYILAQIHNFIWCKYWIFPTEKKSNTWRQVLLFSIAFGMAYGAQFLFLIGLGGTGLQRIPCPVPGIIHLRKCQFPNEQTGDIPLVLPQRSPSLSVKKSFCQSGIGINSAVAQERPPTAYIFRTFQVHLYNDIFRPFVSCLGQELALRSGHKTISPKQDTIGLHGRIRLMSHAIH